jgi:hypothetical protein
VIRIHLANDRVALLALCVEKVDWCRTNDASKVIVSGVVHDAIRNGGFVQSDDAQQAEWLPLRHDWRTISCPAETKLDHRYSACPNHRVDYLIVEVL